MNNVTIYHNPRCSKSREALALLKERNIEPEIRLYLETPPSKEELQSIIAKLGFSSCRDLMRKKEALYTELNLDDPTLTEEQLLEALVNNPKLIERPIVIVNDRAKLGRPNADNILTLF